MQKIKMSAVGISILLVVVMFSGCIDQQGISSDNDFTEDYLENEESEQELPDEEDSESENEESEPEVDEEEYESEPHEHSWQFIRRFSGDGRTTTDPFFIQSDVKWRLDWRMMKYISEFRPGDPDPPSPYFQILVMKAGTISSVFRIFSEGELGDSDSTVIFSMNPQSYYFDIISRNIDEWQIDVYEWI